jgi:small subunit ribosomal protein S17
MADTENNEAEAPEREAGEETSAEAQVAQEPPSGEKDGAEASEGVENDAGGASPRPVPAVAEAQPDEELSPKQRRRRERSEHAGEPRAPRSAEERHAERLAERKAKALRRRARRAQERERAATRRASAPAREPLAPVHAPTEGSPRVRQGVVVSSKADKTITVRIDVARQHRRYEKTVRSSSTLHAHDELGEAHEGDVVRVVESRPLSRTKRWKLVDVLERAR